MDAVLYVKILETTLLPFITEKFALGHRFMLQSILLSWQQIFLRIIM